MWNQGYDPFGSSVLSTLAAAVPAAFLLVLIATGKIKVHIAALIALAVAVVIAVLGFGMPGGMAIRAVALGALTGFFPIGWIILNVIFLYRLTVEKGWFAIMQKSIGDITPDRRLQLLLIAFAFGAFFEGASGFGTPVAVTGSILMGLGFSPLAAAGLSLIANTAPVAFGALGTPIVGLASASGLDALQLGAMVGRQLPIFAVLVPFWLIWAFAGWRGTKGVIPPILVSGISFALPEYLISNFINPWLASIVSSVICLVVLRAFLAVWQPAKIWTSAALRIHDDSHATMPAPPVEERPKPSTAMLVKSWMPWLILCAVLWIWGTDSVKSVLNKLFSPSFQVAGLHNLVNRVPPVVPTPTAEPAVFTFTFLSYSGTAILLSALIAGVFMGYSPMRMVKSYFETIRVVRFSLITIAAMLALGTLTRYAGLDATLGLAFASSGVLYPFFGTLLGWLGVALTGSDTASNVLFGSLQRITSQQLGLSPILMAAANSSGGVMGKMIDAQSIVVASTATRWYGHEGSILRFVFKQSVALAVLVGILVTLQAYVWPFTLMVVK